MTVPPQLAASNDTTAPQESTQTPILTASPIAAGETRISTRTGEHVVACALSQVPGVTTVDSKLAGLRGRGYPRLMVQLDPTTRQAAVDAAIAVTWPCPITEVAKAARTAVTEALATHLGYATTRVNITVGQAEPGRRITPEQLAARVRPQAIAPHYRTVAVYSPQLRPVIGAETAAHTVHSITTPPLTPVRTVATPIPARVYSVAIPTPVQPVGVQAPTPPYPTRVQAPIPARLRPITVKAPTPLRPITVPEPAPLHIPSAPMTTVAPVRVPVPKPLRAIEITTRRTLRDYQPQPS